MSAADALIARPQHALIQLDFESTLPRTFHERSIYVPLSPDCADVEAGFLLLTDVLFQRELEFIKPLREYLRSGEKANLDLLLNGFLQNLSQVPAFHTTLVLDDASIWDTPTWVPILESILENGQQACQLVLVCRDVCQHLPLKQWRARGLLGDHQQSDAPKALDHYDADPNEDTQELYEMTASSDIDSKEEYALHMGRSVNYVLAGQGRDILAFFDSIPFKHYLQRPRLAMAWLWAQALTLRVSDRIQDVMTVVSDYLEKRLTGTAEPLQKDIYLAAQFELFVANVFGSGPLSQDYIAICEEAIAKLDPQDSESFVNEELLCFGKFNLGLALLNKDLAAALPMLEASQELANAYRNTFCQISREVVRAVARIHVQQANWEKAVEMLMHTRVFRFVNYAGEQGMKKTTVEVHLSVRPMHTGLCVASESMLRYYRNDSQKARELAKDVFEHGKATGHPETMIESLLTLALLAAQQHAFDTAQEHLVLAHNIAQGSNLFHVQAALDAHIARLHMRMALHHSDLQPLEQVANWVRQTHLSDDWQQPRTYVPIMLHTPEFEALTYARYALLVGDFDKVTVITNWAKTQIEARGGTFLNYEIEVLQSLVHSDPAQACALLKAALQRVEAQQAPRLILDFGAALGARFDELLGDASSDWITSLRQGFDKDATPFPTPNAAERSILQAMAKAMKPEEIAAAREQPLAETQAHIEHLYQMLGVQHRSDALTKARRLGWV